MIYKKYSRFAQSATLFVSIYGMMGYIDETANLDRRPLTEG
jgi:hypothetical protein